MCDLLIFATPYAKASYPVSGVRHPRVRGKMPAMPFQRNVIHFRYLFQYDESVYQVRRQRVAGETATSPTLATSQRPGEPAACNKVINITIKWPRSAGCVNILETSHR